MEKDRSARSTAAAKGGRTTQPAKSPATAKPATPGRTARPAAAATAAPRATTAKKPAAAGKGTAAPKRTAPAAGKTAQPRRTRAEARAAARRARQRRRLLILACALVCLLAVGGALALHLLGRRDATVDAGRTNAPQPSAAAEPEAVFPAAEPLEAGEGEAVPAESPAAEPAPEAPAAESAPEAPAEAAEPEASPAADPFAAADPTAAALFSDGEAAAPFAPMEDEAESPQLADMPLAPIPEVREVFEMGQIVESALPTNGKYKYTQKFVANGKTVKSYERETPVAMGTGEEYAQVDGVLTFRGNNYRDGGAFGTIPNDATGLSIVWTKKIGSIEKWTGVGWTGQASIVRWPAETRQIMNLNAIKKGKDGLKEVIYGTLDGHIYFLDLDDGEATRDPIAVPSSIKGSVSVDPRGYPLLYCGQGIPTVKGKNVKIGTRVFSLIDQETLFFLNGRDEFCPRGWYAFDCAPLVDAASDTMLQLGENGVVYTVKLNTRFDADAGRIAVDPVVDRMIYRSAVTTRLGMENSLSVYDHYAYYTDNSGLLTCLDLNTLKPVWLADVGDDSDASVVIEQDEDGVWLYQVCELDLNGLNGNVYCRRFNALTGEQLWQIPVACHRYNESVDAGGFATPALGKGELGDLVFFNVCRVKEGGGALAAVNKETGEVVWVKNTGAYSWSSPVCVYDGNGRGYLILGNSNGILRLYDGRTGDEIAAVDLGANMEGSPAVFDDMLVIGTRGARIYGVRITN